MDDLVPHALGFCPQAANRIQSGLASARRRYHGVGPLLFGRDLLRRQI